MPGRGGCLGSPAQQEQDLGPHVRLKPEIARGLLLGLLLEFPGQAE